MANTSFCETFSLFLSWIETYYSYLTFIKFSIYKISYTPVSPLLHINSSLVGILGLIIALILPFPLIVRILGLIIALILLFPFIVGILGLIALVLCFPLIMRGILSLDPGIQYLHALRPLVPGHSRGIKVELESRGRERRLRGGRRHLRGRRGAADALLSCNARSGFGGLPSPLFEEEDPRGDEGEGSWVKGS